MFCTVYGAMMEQLELFPYLQHSETNAKLLLLWNQEQAVEMYNAEKFRKLTFREAAPVFVEFKSRHVKPKTKEMYDLYVKHLMDGFASKTLESISIREINAYQAFRLEQGAGASLINHEVNTLAQMMKKAGKWKQIGEWYKPVQSTEQEPLKVMAEEDEERFFKVAASNPDFQIAYWVASITNNTSCAGCEIRTLRLGDIDLQSDVPKIRVSEGKNHFRKYRTVPLNLTAYKQMGRMVARAVEKGARSEEHFLFPFRVKKNEWDPTRHASASWLKKQWKKLCEAAGVDITPHKLRFQCATRMVENGVPEETIVKVFGWRNTKMLRHYSRPRLNSALEAVQKIEPTAKKGSTAAPKAWMPRFAQNS